MFSIFAWLQQYIHVLVFLLLEFVSFFLIVNYNQTQKEIFIHSSSLFAGSFLERSSKIDAYLSLKETNAQLLMENARLMEEIITTSSMRNDNEEFIDSSTLFNYYVTPAHIISQNVHATRNYITIDKGSNDGVKTSTAVVTNDGVVGIVKKVSPHFSTVMSLLNLDTKISASIEGQNFFGTISWDGAQLNQVQLSGIPQHANLHNGDWIITNGYSTIFPKAQYIGQISSFKTGRNGVFYEINVQLSNDFSSLHDVYILNNTFAAEIEEITNEE